MRTTPIFALLLAIPFLTAAGCPQDEDFDDIGDDVDNCLELYNPTQDDGDADGLGNACDDDQAYLGVDATGCWNTNWPPFRGIGWDDKIMEISGFGPQPTDLNVSIDWQGGGYETGDGSTDGEKVWFHVTSFSQFSTATYVEATTFDDDGDGKADRMEGSYVFTECDDEFDLYFCLEPSSWEILGVGEMIAERLSESECVGQ